MCGGGGMAGSPVLIFEYRSAPISETALPARIVDEWESTLKLARTRILASLDRFLAEPGGRDAFLNQIADASSDAYEMFVNPTYPLADIIKLKQRIKLAGAYDAWKSGVTYAFQSGSTFELNVTAKKSKFDNNVRLTIGGVGFKPETWGSVSKLSLLLVGDIRPVRYMTADETFNTGEAFPRNVFSEAGKGIVPAIISTYVHGVVMVLWTLRGGVDSGIRDSIASAVNSRLAKLASARDPDTYVTLELQIDTDTGKPVVYGRAEKI